MPNICTAQGNVTGSQKNIRKFLDLFLSGDLKDEVKERYFARSILVYGYEELEESTEKENEIITIDIVFNCAWSVQSCMISGYPSRFQQCPTLEEVLKELDLDIHLDSEELGLGFREVVDGDADGVDIICVEGFVSECPNCQEAHLVDNDASDDLLSCPECSKQYYLE